MESTCEPNLEELTLLLDHLACEYVRTNDKDRRIQIASEISKLIGHISAVKSRPPPGILNE